MHLCWLIVLEYFALGFWERLLGFSAWVVWIFGCVLFMVVFTADLLLLV